MGKFVYFKNNFTAGESSPKFESRTDTQQFFNSVKKLENMILMPQGGVTKRPGSRYLAAVTGVSSNTGSLRFISSRSEAYIVLLTPNGTNNFVKIYSTAGGLATINISADLPSATAALFGSKWHSAQSADTMWITNSSALYPPMILKRTAVDTFYLAPLLDQQAGFATNIYTNYYPLRTAYMDPNVDGNKKLRPSATTGTITLFAEDATATPISFFNSNHVGSIFKLTISGRTGFVRVTVFTSASQVTGEVYPIGGADLGGTTATDNWEESAFSNYRGWPRAVTLFEQRLIFGGTFSEPDKVFCSVVGNPYYMMQNKLVQDASANDSGFFYFGAQAETDAFSFLPASAEVNPIQWLSSGRDLNIGTLGAELVANGGSDRIMSKESIQVKTTTAHGSFPLPPLRINQNMYFVTRDARRLLEYAYDAEVAQFATKNLNLIADHVYFGEFDSDEAFGVTESYIHHVFSQDNRNVIWVITKAGELKGITLNSAAQVAGWHTHTLAGSNTASRNGQAVVVTGCTLPSDRFSSVSAGATDDIYLLVKREINASTVYFLERIEADFEHVSLANTEFGYAESSPVYLDSCLYSTTGGAVSSITGLAHLNGETVYALLVNINTKECYIRSGVVAAGALALGSTYDVTNYVAGLLYTPKLYFNRLEAGADFGTAQGLVQRIDRAVIRFYRSYAAKVGVLIKDLTSEVLPGTNPSEELEDINFLPPGHVLDHPILYTGDKRVDLQADPSSEEQETIVVITQDLPYPLTVLGVSFRGVIYD